MPRHDRNPHERPLRLALLANGTFSSLSAIVCLALPGALASQLGLPASQVLGLGVELLAFAGLVLFLANRPTMTTPWVRRTVLGVAIADIVWVVVSIALLVRAPEAMTTTGRWMIGIVALFVADFAFFQLYGLRRLKGAPTAMVKPIDGGRASNDRPVHRTA